MDEFDLKLQQALAKRKAAQDAMGSFQAPEAQMVGGRYIRPSFGDALAQGLKLYQGQKDLQQVDQEIPAMMAQRSEANNAAMANYLRQMQGAQENKPADGMGPVQQAEAPNMQGAFSALMQAPDQNLRQMGMQGVTQYAQQQAVAAQKKQEDDRINQLLKTLSPQEAIAAGVPDVRVKAYYESKNYGRNEVKYERDGAGNLVPVTKYGDTPTGVQTIKNTGNPFSDLLVTDPVTGQIVQNQPLVGAKVGIAKAGKPVVNVTNKIENKAAENIAGQVGGILKDSATAAEGAVKTLDAANRVINAIDSGKIIAGPMANARVSLSQAAQLLGVGGKDNAEVLANTRSVIRGLAEMTLQGRKQMSGQGAITESESKLAEKAASGDITDLTPAEIRQLAQASSRASQWTMQSHKSKLDAAGKLPGTAGLVPFFSTPEAPEYSGAPASAAQPQINSLLEKYK